MNRTLQLMVIGAFLVPSPGWGEDRWDGLTVVFNDMKSVLPHDPEIRLTTLPEPDPGKFDSENKPIMADVPKGYLGKWAVPEVPKFDDISKSTVVPFVVTNAIFDKCGSPDKLAFALAHAMAHLSLNHPLKYANYYSEQYELWHTIQPKQVQDLEDKEKTLKFRDDRKNDLESFLETQEPPADKMGPEIIESFNKKPSSQKYGTNISCNTPHPRLSTPSFLYEKASSKFSDRLNESKKFKELNLSLPADWNK